MHSKLILTCNRRTVASCLPLMHEIQIVHHNRRLHFSSEIPKPTQVWGKRYPKPLKTRKHGLEILHDPLWNKSESFSIHERDRLGLRGLLPPVVRTIDEQIRRKLRHLRSLPDNVTRNLYLQEVHNQNETIYHRMLIDYVSTAHSLTVYGAKVFYN